MRDEYHNNYMDEEEEEGFKTPLVQDKKKKKKNKIAIETHNQDEEKTMTIKVKQISEKPDRVPPIVAYFASGYDPCAGNPESDERDSPKVTVYRHKAESRKRLQVVVSPPGSNVEFVGTNYTGEQAARQTCVYSLGVLDRETQTLKILPIAHNKIFRLEPRVKTEETVHSEASASVVTEELTEKPISKYSAKKDINRDKKKKALNLGVDPETHKLLDGKLNEVDVKPSALESTSSFVARNIPPYNASATTPVEVYPLSKIIDNGEWHFLQDVYWLLQEETGVATDAYPEFVRNRLYKLRDIKDETEKQTISGVLSLITHLVKFKDIDSMKGLDSAKNHRFPDIIRQKCNSLFKGPEFKRIPEEKINLLISYVLVLSLHVDNFKTDPEDIAKDLRMSGVDLRKHFENLGCKLAQDKSRKVMLATLPVPLTFPQIIRNRKQRR